MYLSCITLYNSKYMYTINGHDVYGQNALSKVNSYNLTFDIEHLYTNMLFIFRLSQSISSKEANF